MPLIIRNTFQKNKVTIILYHNIEPLIFEKHIKVLKKLYNLIDLEDFLLFREGKLSTLPIKSLIITFDDGHKENYKLLSILRKYNVSVTIFLCSGIIGSKKQFWFKYCKNKSVDTEKLKRLDDNKRIEFLENIGFDDRVAFEEPSALSFCEINEMSQIVNFQSHTMSHPILTSCNDDKSYQEIKNSKEKLEGLLNKPIYAIAYPNGDFSNREIQFAKECNYKLGLTLLNGYNTKNTDPFKLKRIPLDDDNASIDEWIVKTSGIWFFLRNSLENLHLI